MNRTDIFQFRLYVAGEAQNSVQARVNLHSLCETHLAKRYEIEVIDVFREQKRALDDSVFMTPTLLKLAPPITRRIVGTLSQTDDVLLALGVDPAFAP
ncbi:circadian clock protein KaiB [Chitinimonas arctica]|uniref:Circadian clock protein KaiB n=1 Tax=Chitinimonas arctica TaxID=2594795 RepID=A0A516SEG6_9NEIS|nr:circadian clock KaiB family protein [Chitinimonas arctica]QDQ26552.1 circadian clock protein KaiB [Chitinimonas arctica]